MKIKEGLAEIEVPAGKQVKKDEVFYNPHMKFNRDISVLALQAFQSIYKPKLKLAIEPMAASGIRGIRYLLEAGHIEKMIFNDLNPRALKILEKNIKKNKISSKAIIESKEASSLLHEFRHQVDLVDIDPFGTPVQFLDAAAHALVNNSLLMVTATDTAPLAGTYPKACLRKYGATPLREDIMHEVGIRILIATIVKECAKYEKGFEPMVSFSKRHYFRIAGRVENKRSSADRSLSHLDHIHYCKKCGDRGFGIEQTCDCGGKITLAGPLWIGNMNNSKFLEEMTKENDEKILKTLLDESKINNLFFDIHYLCKKNQLKIPRTEELIQAIKDKGSKVSRTHFSPTGLRTDLPLTKIIKIIEKF